MVMLTLPLRLTAVPSVSSRSMPSRKVTMMRRRVSEPAGSSSPKMVTTGLRGCGGGVVGEEGGAGGKGGVEEVEEVEEEEEVEGVEEEEEEEEEVKEEEEEEVEEE